MKNYLILLALLIPVRTVFAAPLPCLIEPQESVELGSSRSGVIDTIFVTRGQTVHKGQIVARLANRVAHKTVDLASLQVHEVAEIDAAQEAFDHAEREQRRLAKLYTNQLVSRQELDDAIATLAEARYALESAKTHRQVARLQLALEQAKLEQFTLRSPIDGIVAEIYSNEGQYIREQAVVKIVALQTLHVEVIAPAERYGQIQPGQTYPVTPELPNTEAQTATVRIVDPMLDAASNTFRITLDLPNPKQTIPAGARCSVSLDNAD